MLYINIYKYLSQIQGSNMYRFLYFNKEKKTKQNNGEVYFSCYVVWMYVLLPPCILMSEDYIYQEIQWLVIFFSQERKKNLVQGHSYTTFFCAFFLHAKIMRAICWCKLTKIWYAYLFFLEILISFVSFNFFYFLCNKMFLLI